MSEGQFVSSSWHSWHCCQEADVGLSVIHQQLQPTVHCCFLGVPLNKINTYCNCWLIDSIRPNFNPYITTFYKYRPSGSDQDCVTHCINSENPLNAVQSQSLPDKFIYSDHIFFTILGEEFIYFIILTSPPPSPRISNGRPLRPQAFTFPVHEKMK